MSFDKIIGSLRINDLFMKKVAIAALAVLAPTVALATDFAPRIARPAPAPAPIVVPVVEAEQEPSPPEARWTGFYLGGNVGYAWTKSSFTHSEGGAAGESFTNNPNKVIGGAQLGARYQILNNWVLGVEARFDFRNQDHKTRTDLNAIPRYRLSRVGHIWSVAGMSGFAFGNYLAYGKAGYARTRLNYENISIGTGEVLGQSKADVGGYVLGTGLEYALTKNISIGIEYDFLKFKVGDQAQLTTAGAPAGAANVKNDLTTHSGALKGNYRF